MFLDGVRRLNGSCGRRIKCKQIEEELFFNHFLIQFFLISFKNLEFFVEFNC